MQVNYLLTMGRSCIACVTLLFALSLAVVPDESQLKQETEVGRVTGRPQSSLETAVAEKADDWWWNTQWWLPDSDPCKYKNGGCHSFASCENNDGTAVCDCLDGFTGDGKNCREICPDAPVTTCNLHKLTFGWADGCKEGENLECVWTETGLFNVCLCKPGYYNDICDFAGKCICEHKCGDKCCSPDEICWKDKCYSHNIGFKVDDLELQVGDSTAQSFEDFTFGKRLILLLGAFVGVGSLLLLCKGKKNPESYSLLETDMLEL